MVLEAPTGRETCPRSLRARSRLQRRIRRLVTRKGVTCQTPHHSAPLHPPERFPRRARGSRTSAVLGLFWVCSCGGDGVAPLDLESASPVATPAASSTGAATPPVESPSLQPKLAPLPELQNVTLMGQSQAESPYFNPVPEESSLDEYADWLEPGEGLPYPVRKLEWTFLGGPAGGPLALGPGGEIYAASQSDRSPELARYTPGGQWMWEALPIHGDTSSFRINELEVTADGVVWAATTDGLFTRSEGAWHAAGGVDAARYRRVEGIRFGADGSNGIVFLDYDVLSTSGEDGWTRWERELPLLLSLGVQAGRRWQGWVAGATGWLGATDSDVVWRAADGSTEIYPIRAKDVAFGVNGELLVMGETSLLVSENHRDWQRYPVSIGGYRGGNHQLVQITVSPSGDAYVLGEVDVLFHRFPDASLELLSTPDYLSAVDANDTRLVVVNDEGIWLTNPRGDADTSGVFEAVVPTGYQSNLADIVPASGLLELPAQAQPPECFDFDLATRVGARVAPVETSNPQRLRFQAPETGTYQFRREALEDSTLAGCGSMLTIWSDCARTNYDTGNPLHVALEAGQYVVVEQAPAGGCTPSDETWLSIY